MNECYTSNFLMQLQSVRREFLYYFFTNFINLLCIYKKVVIIVWTILL